ncbi:hypothetical protein JCM10212_003697 [Sporobolomyces blumeae]
MPTILNSAVALPPATRTLTLALIASSTLYAFVRFSNASNDPAGILVDGPGDAGSTVPWLTLVPAKVAYAPWTLLTAAFTETNLIEFLVSLLTLPLCGRYLERVWGAQELVKFVVFTVVVSNVIAVVVSVIESVVLGNKALFLYNTSYHGLEALQVGFLVAFTQLIPEHQVQMFGGVVKMRVKSLPMLYVTFSNVACLLGYQSPYILIQFGWLVSWLYLRFYKRTEGSDFRGDRSDTFAFASWFPPFIQKYVVLLSNFVFSLAVRFRLLQPWTDIESGGLGSSIGPNGSATLGPGGAGAGGGAYAAVPGGQRAEAERRRAMALEALDRRMATKPTSTTAGPSAPAAAAAAVGSAGVTGPSPSTTPEPLAAASAGGVGKGGDGPGAIELSGMEKA